MKRERKWKMWAAIRKHDSESWLPHLFFWRDLARAAAKKNGLSIIEVEVRELKPKKRARGTWEK
jgi:hypothetical protein